MRFLNETGCEGCTTANLRPCSIRGLRLVLWAFAFGIAFSAPASAGDKYDMQQFIREQRQEEKRRQRDQARAQERAAQLLREQQARRAAQQQLNNQKSSESSAGRVVSRDSDNDDSSDNNGIGKKRESTSSNDKKNDADRSDDKLVVDDDEGPPPTIEKWWKKLTAPADRPVVKRVDSVVETVADKNPATAINGAAEKADVRNVQPPNAETAKPAIAKAVPSKPASGGRPEPIEFLEVPRPEVLAINASSETLQRAQSLGFTAAPATQLVQLDFSVTKLLPPAGMSFGDAQALLQAQVPSGSFAPNQTYRIYRTASGNETKPSGVPPSPAAEGGTSCGVDRCFARDVIGWKPELGKCVAGLKVGIIDTSVDVTHPTFAQRKIEVRHFGPKDRQGPDWHGTGVAALLAGDGKSATPGLIPDASFYVADIFYAGEDKGPASDTLSMLRAFNWLETKGVKIINMSLSGPPDTLIQKAVAKLASKGILLVAAAGNDGPHNVGASYPAAYEDVIAVTAVNKNLQNYRYANRGSYVDIAAPGVAIWTALPGAQQGYHSGTSFATPYVTATLAAIYSQIGGQNSKSVLDRLQFRDLGEAGNDPVYGRGLLIAPASCTGGQIAAAPPPPQPAPSLFSFFATSSPPAPAAPAEELPWLSYQGSGN